MGPRQNRTRDDTEQLKSTPAACDRIPTSVASNKQFTHSLVIRHKLQLCRSNSVGERQKRLNAQILAGAFFYSFLALVGFDRFAQLYRVSCLLLFLLPRHSWKVPNRSSRSRGLWNCCSPLCHTCTDTSCVLTEVADSPARGQAKQNAQLDASSLRRNEGPNFLQGYHTVLTHFATTNATHSCATLFRLSSTNVPVRHLIN
ncbi:hypothetical protein TcasGA2_TC000879 [Tribolium castaneum]|uniref:Uncharacterized protein n=1 Tax=Tribolium castaneum TaxID=7070 RepID=D6W8Y5_TRICA|nr:hypothetical protein TcasGA2_TC000879 [Tribolium castaneum]